MLALENFNKMWRYRQVEDEERALVARLRLKAGNGNWRCAEALKAFMSKNNVQQRWWCHTEATSHDSSYSSCAF